MLCTVLQANKPGLYAKDGKHGKKGEERPAAGSCGDEETKKKKSEGGSKVRYIYI